MNKLVRHMIKPVFFAFCLAVIAGVMYWSFGALSRIFPGDLASQLFGLMQFDVAAVVWFFVLVTNSRSTAQYVWSGFGFLLGFAGTVGLVGIEVGLSSGFIEAAEIVQELTYIFIAAVVGHLFLTYAFHASEPEVSADISLGIDKAKISDKAQAAVEKKIDEKIDALASPIANELMRKVLQDLNISAHFKEDMVLPALPVENEAEKQEEQAKQNFLSWLPVSLGNVARKWNKNAASVAVASPVVTPKPSPAAQSAASEEAEGLELKGKVTCMNCSTLIDATAGTICPTCGWKSPGTEPSAENELHRRADRKK